MSELQSKTGLISEEQFSKGIGEVVNDKNAAIMCTYIFQRIDTFKAYDSDGDNMISKKQFMRLIEQSWIVAFRILAETGDESKMGNVSMRDIDNWASSKISHLNEQTAKLFNRMDPTKKGVNFVF